MQVNFVHIISFKVASYSACYLTNGVYIRYLLEKLTRENKVIAAAKRWKFFFSFSSNSEGCIVILQNVSMQAPGNFHVS